MSHDAATAPTAAELPAAAVEHHHHHHHHHHFHHHDDAGSNPASSDAPKPSWTMYPSSGKKSSRSSKKNKSLPPPPYTDDPTAKPASYDYEDAADAEAQRRGPHPCVIRDILVVVLQLVLLFLMGYFSYQWYADFNAQWQHSHAAQIAAEVQRREQLLVSRAAAKM